MADWLDDYVGNVATAPAKEKDWLDSYIGGSDQPKQEKSDWLDSYLGTKPVQTRSGVSDESPPSAVQQRMTVGEGLKRAGKSLLGYVKEQIPQTKEEALRALNIPTNWKDPTQLAEFVAPPLKIPFGTAAQAKARTQQIIEAEKTPKGSQERFDAGIGTVLDIAQLAAMAKAPDFGSKITPKTPVEPSVPEPATPSFKLKQTPSGPMLETPEGVQPQAVAEANVEAQKAISGIKQTVPETPKPETTGVSNRVFADLAAQGKLQEIGPGEGLSTEETIIRGRTLKSQGASPDVIAQKFQQTGAISPDESFVLRAHLEDLHKEYALADKEREANPDSPKAIEKSNLAWKNFSDWAQNVMQPVKTKASDLFRGFQGETDINTGEFSDLRRYVFETKGRDIKPTEEQQLRQQAKTVKKAVDAEAEAVQKLGEVISKGPKARPKTLDERRAFIADFLKTQMPC